MFVNKKSDVKLEKFLIALGFLFSLMMFRTLMLHTDNLQLMDKVVKIHQEGQWIHHGNAATKMGELPGSFLTVITAVPMMFWFNPYAACAVILLFHLISYLLIRDVSAKFFGGPFFSPIMLAIFYWLNPWRVEQSELYNPGYLFLFAALHIWTAFKLNREESFWMTFLHVVTIGLCFQVHFSVLILGVSSLYLFYFRQIKVNWRGFATGAVFIILTLIPWMIEKIHGGNHSLETHSDTFWGKNFVLVYPVLKAILYFFRMGSAYFGRHIFSEIEFSWITSESLQIVVSNIFHVLKYVIAVVTLLVSFKFLGKYLWQNLKRFKKKQFEQLIFRDHYFLSLFIGVFVSAALSPVEFNHWHFILVFPAIILYLIWLVMAYITAPHKAYDFRKIILCFILIYSVWDIFAALGSRSHSIRNNYSELFKQHYKTDNSH